MKLAIVVPYSHNRFCTWSFRQCLRSIARHEPELAKHTLICDNGFPDRDKYPMLASMQKEFGAHLLWKKDHGNYGAAINCGIKAARQAGYDYVALLNPRVELKSKFIERAQTIFDTYEQVGIIGARLHFPDGKIQHEGYEFKKDKTFNYFGGGTFDTVSNSGPIQGVSSAFQILRLSHILKYPENYQSSYGDVEVCLKSWERDVWTWYEPSISGINITSNANPTERTECEDLMALRSVEFDFGLIETHLAHARQLVSSDRLPRQSDSHSQERIQASVS